MDPSSTTVNHNVFSSAVCRVCRSQEPVLLTPCKCSGSMKYVHQECLEEWLKHSGKKHCEICNYKFKFTPIYSENVPETLNIGFLIKILIQKITSSALYSLRIWLALTGWLMVVPLLVALAWKVYFSPSKLFSFSDTANESSEADHVGLQINQALLNLPIPSPMARYIVQEVFFGQVICLSFLSVAFMLLLLKEYIVANTPREQRRIPVENLGIPPRPDMQAQGEMPIRNQEDVLRPLFDINNQRPINQRPPIHPFMERLDRRLREPSEENQARFEGRIMSDNQAIASSNINSPNSDNESPVSAVSNIGINTNDFAEDSEHSSGTDSETNLDQWQFPGLNHQENDDDSDDDGNNENNNNDNNDNGGENINININFQINNNGIGAQVRAEGDFASIVGIKGPVIDLFQNIVVLSLLIAACIGAFIWFPFNFGRIIVYLSLNFVIAGPLNLIGKSLDKFNNIASPFLGESVRLSLSWISQRLNIKKFALIHSFKVDAIMYLVGVVLVSFVVINRLQHTRIWKTPYMKTLRKTIKSTLIYMLKLQKLSTFLFIELILFPTFCGILVDVSTLPLLQDAKLQRRIDYHNDKPWTSAFVHWVIGTCVMVLFAQLVSGIREVVRPGVLWFVRDPSDPHFNPMREIMEKPVWHQIQKLFKGTIMYSTVIYSVFGGLRLVGFLYSIMLDKFALYFVGDSVNLLPVCLLACNTPLFRAPIDLLVYMVFVPTFIKSIKPECHAKTFLKKSFRVISRLLLLSHFMFGEDQDLHLSAASNKYLQVPNHDHINYRPGDKMLRLIGKDDVLIPKEGENDEDVNANWKKVSIPHRFGLRLLIFGVLEWFSIVTFIYTVFALPVLIGRHSFSKLRTLIPSNPDVGVNDVYSALLGAMILMPVWKFSELVLSLIKVTRITSIKSTDSSPVQQGDTLNNEEVAVDEQSELVKELKLTGEKFVKVVAGSVIFGIVVPMLAGAAFECYVRYPVIFLLKLQTYKLDLIYIWSWGGLLVSLVSGLVVVGRENELKILIHQIRDQGFSSLDMNKVVNSYLVPFTRMIMGLICLPFAGGYLVQYTSQTLGYMELNPYPYAFPIAMIIGAVMGSAVMIRTGVQLWIDHVRDEQFMVGRRLNNIQ